MKIIKNPKKQYHSNCFLTVWVFVKALNIQDAVVGDGLNKYQFIIKKIVLGSILLNEYFSVFQQAFISTASGDEI